MKTKQKTSEYAAKLGRKSRESALVRLRLSTREKHRQKEQLRRPTQRPMPRVSQGLPVKGRAERKMSRQVACFSSSTSKLSVLGVCGRLC